MGENRETTWRRLLAGEGACRWIDPERRIAGAPAPMVSGGNDVARLAAVAAEEAWRDGRLRREEVDRERLGCVFGTSKGDLNRLLNGDAAIDADSSWIDFWPSGAASVLAGRFHCQGPVIAPVAACATGLVACLRGAELIESDLCDVVLAGSADASLFPAVVYSFRRLGVLAKVEGNPATACRPFDRGRTGFLVGEGAACLVLERRSHAERRGARWYAEWLGGRMGSDPAGLTRIDDSGATLARLVRDVADDCGRAPEYVNLHGTATRSNDVAECRALRSVFGAAADGISCSGLKGSLGHLLGAAGSVELAMTVLALRDQIVPPTVNLVDPDPACSLDLTPGRPRRRRINMAVKISSGFGGHVAVAAVGTARIGG